MDGNGDELMAVAPNTNAHIATAPELSATSSGQDKRRSVTQNTHLSIMDRFTRVTPRLSYTERWKLVDRTD